MKKYTCRSAWMIILIFSSTLLWAQNEPYHGGFGRGDTSMRTSLLACNNFRFAGGDGNGDNSIRTNLLNCNGFLFAGGFGSGDTSIRTNLVSCNSFLFAGGLGKGDTSIATNLLSCNIFRFNGDTAAGFANMKTNLLNCNTFRFQGDSADGYAGQPFVKDEYCNKDKTILQTAACASALNGKFSNCFATAEAGEPIGTAWAANGIQRTIWFRFKPPTIKAFTIETTNNSFDPEMAVYDGSSALGCPGCQLASAEGGGVGVNAKVTLSCLDTARYYFVQINGKSGSSGTFDILITDLCNATPAYSGGDICGTAAAVSATGVYTMCLSPNGVDAGDPNATAMTAIATVSTTVCAGAPITNTMLAHSTYLPITTNAAGGTMTITITQNASSCGNGIKAMLFNTGVLACPAPAQWGSTGYPLVGCYQGTGLGAIFSGTVSANTTYYLLVDGVNGDGGLVTINASGGALPISLSSFNGNTVNAVNKLKWVTSAEINSRHFELERSADGINFKQLAIVLAAGNSTANNHYGYDDAAPLQGNNFYRLKMVDMDGRFKHSQIILLKNTGKENEVVLYPNPASAFVNITTAFSDGYSFEVQDMLGKSITKANIFTANARLDTRQFANGTYLLKITTKGGKSIAKKFVVER